MTPALIASIIRANAILVQIFRDVAKITNASTVESSRLEHSLWYFRHKKGIEML